MVFPTFESVHGEEGTPNLSLYGAVPPYPFPPPYSPMGVSPFPALPQIAYQNWIAARNEPTEEAKMNISKQSNVSKTMLFQEGLL